ncbi:MAG: type II toxin-antitoxin system PemK/MazF family toxin [Acidimicrobiaceae bacterium]|nr:type II toxin-antitoxin system PemK/MazF family toxin [Acidimicrobiaceae bacterium]MXZ64417.1 type II toxin-antitoxin system PemK/MazF family toxin [Acidimicrobiaceae bacterium]MYF34979.1 type II toxin-antitoxin system PemK/MazF family toxin [Acidimicrobiaceae bacterium]MYG77755.1 type II toxin-antitoxin system PemK/MazF family toxin [Acidimicrobiaceae bacterium]MYJ35918.1 type II toxin-antitoxin system PemK/MazF family toxin [Acidimicrobiaceae bacterium]
MVTDLQRGQVWWGELEAAGRRPFLVMSRNAAIPVLNSVLAAPVTRIIRGIPTELLLGPEDGMGADCVASFDNLRVVPKANLVDHICSLRPGRLAEACVALRTAVDC